MRVLICGSRTFSDGEFIETVLDGLEVGNDFSVGSLVVIEGGAPGPDSIAGRYAGRHDQTMERVTFAADWATHGKAAGAIRNQQMLDEGKPELVVAFVDKPLQMSRGTADMVRRAKKAGLPVYVVEKM